MFKVFALAVVMANLAVLSRFWRVPQRAQGLVMGLQWAALGCSLACLSACLLALCFPGPYRLSIYTIALNMLMTPGLATFGIIMGLRRMQKSAAPPPPNFQEVMQQVTGEGASDETK